MEELVSVIMPTYNGSKTIERAINSALNQTYNNIEVIVVNDFSTDNVKQVVGNIRDSRVSFYDVDRKVNASHARNFGFSKSKGKYIALLDDDDVWKNLKIEKQVEYLKNNKERVAVITDYNLVQGENVKLIRSNSKDYTKDILLMNIQMAAGSNLLVRRSAFEKLNGFDESFEGHQDLEFAIRLDQTSKIGHISGALLDLFGHSGRVSKNADRLISIKEKYFEKFFNVINQYPKDIVLKVFARQWLQVARNYSLEGNFQKSQEYLKTSLSYSFLKSKYIPFLPYESYYLILFRNAISQFIRKNK